MNVERIFFWIRLLSQVIPEIFDRVEEETPGEGEEVPWNPGTEMKPERIQFWLRILARAALQTLDGFAGGGQEMKPERIQFWLELITDFVVAVFAAVDEETGKSGERPDESASAEVDW